MRTQGVKNKGRVSISYYYYTPINYPPGRILAPSAPSDYSLMTNACYIVVISAGGFDIQT